MYAEVCRFIIRLTHLRKPWKHYDNIQHQVMVERLCFLFRWNSRHRKKYMAIMTTRRHAEISDLSPKKFPLPYPKISATPQRPWLAWAAALRQPLGHFCVSATPTKSATSIEPCLVIRNTGDHEGYGFQDFVAALRVFLRHWPKKVSQWSWGMVDTYDGH